MKLLPGNALGMRSFRREKPEEAYEPSMVWIVQAKMRMLMPSSPGETIRAGEGFLVIDDSNGEILLEGTGFDPIGPSSTSD